MSVSPYHLYCSFLKSVSDYYDHIIRCHLSLPAFPRERFAKVAQPCCNNTVPVARPFAVGIARRPVKHVSRREPDEGKTKTKWRGLCRPKSVIESQKRAEPGSSSGDPRMMAAASHSTADGMHCMAPREHGVVNQWNRCHFGSNVSSC